MPRENLLRPCIQNLVVYIMQIFHHFQRKCGNKKKEIWPWVSQEIQPTLDELGILTPEQMGYDKPELATPDVFEMH